MATSLFKTLFLSLLFLFPLAAKMQDDETPILKTGVYTLSGSNPRSSKINYQGSVEIEKRGQTYELTWTVGGNQVQTGVGILKGNILSVAYMDLAKQQEGVISFTLVGQGELEGAWAALGSSSCGKEWLVFDRDAPKNQGPYHP